MSVRHVPGSALIHPVSLASLVAMLINDHVLKRVCPGWLSGKLSDFACLVLLPLFLHASFEVASAWRGRPLSAKAANRVLSCCVALSVAVFAAVELFPICERAYRVVFGALQWPYYALAALVRGTPIPGLGLVRATADVSDLLALPMGVLAHAVGRRRVDSSARPSRIAVAACVAGALVGFAAPANAEEKSSWRKHDGWYLGGELGAGAAFVDSSASISNGFQQPIDASASGAAAPVWGIELGHTVEPTNVVIGVRLGGARLDEPVIESSGERFRIEQSEFELIEGQGFVDYYPNPHGGFHVGAGFGIATLQRMDVEHGRKHFGYGLALEAGQGFWLGRSWSIGAVLRVSAARMTGSEFGTTLLLLPALCASLAWH